MKRTDLARYLDLVRRRWQMLVLIVAVVVGASLLQSLTSTKLYETSSRVVIVEQNAADVVVERPARDLGRALPTERRALESQELEALVTEQLRTDVDVRFGTQSPDLLVITARDSDPAAAAVAANVYASTFVEFRQNEAIERISITRRQLLAEAELLEDRINALDQAIDEDPNDRSAGIAVDNRRLQRDQFLSQIDELDFLIASETGGLELGETAGVPSQAVSPRPLRGAAFALVLGSIVALAIALALEAIDDTVRSSRRLAGLTKGAPVLGVIPPYAGAAPTIATLDRPDDPATEAYSNLRTAFLAVLRDQTRPIVQVTSAGAGEGKSVVATNLAVTLSQIGLRVALIDADLRNPSIRRFFPQLPDTGLSEILEGNLPIDTQLSDVGETTVLHALPAGMPDASPAELLSSPTAKQVFGRIAVEHDVTIVDTSSVIGFADANVIAALADFTLMVVRAGETKSEQVRRAFDALALIDARPLGVVLTDSRDSATGSIESFAPARRIRRRGADESAELKPGESDSESAEDNHQRRLRQTSSNRFVGGRGRRHTREPAETLAYPPTENGSNGIVLDPPDTDFMPLQPDDPLPTPLAVYDVESSEPEPRPVADPAETTRLGTAAAIAAVHQTTQADETSPAAVKPATVPPAPPPESAIADATAKPDKATPETSAPEPASADTAAVKKPGAKKPSATKAGSSKPSTKPANPSKTNGDKASPAKASPAKASPAKASPAKAKTAQANTAKADSAKADSDKADSDKADSDKAAAPRSTAPKAQPASSSPVATKRPTSKVSSVGPASTPNKPSRAKASSKASTATTAKSPAAKPKGKDSAQVPPPPPASMSDPSASASDKPGSSVPSKSPE